MPSAVSSASTTRRSPGRRASTRQRTRSEAHDGGERPGGLRLGTGEREREVSGANPQRLGALRVRAGAEVDERGQRARQQVGGEQREAVHAVLARRVQHEPPGRRPALAARVAGLQQQVPLGRRQRGELGRPRRVGAPVAQQPGVVQRGRVRVRLAAQSGLQIAERARRQVEERRGHGSRRSEAAAAACASASAS